MLLHQSNSLKNTRATVLNGLFYWPPEFLVLLQERTSQNKVVCCKRAVVAGILAVLHNACCMLYVCHTHTTCKSHLSPAAVGLSFNEHSYAI